MSIQEVAITNNQKKKLLKAVKDKAVLFEDDNGDLVVKVEIYLDFKKELRGARAIKKGLEAAPIEAILGDDVLDFDAEYFVFN